MSSSQDTQQQQHGSNDDDEKQPQPQSPRCISFSLLVTVSAVCLCVLLMASLLPTLLVFADRSHHRLIASVTLERATLLRSRIFFTLNATVRENRQAGNFTRLLGLPFASNASLRRYSTFFTRFATRPPLASNDGGSRVVACRFMDNSWVHAVHSGAETATGVVQLNNVAGSHFDPLIHSGYEQENITDVSVFSFNATSLTPLLSPANLVQPVRYATRSWVGGSFWNSETQKMPQLSRIRFAGADVVATFFHVALPYATGGAQLSSCSTVLRHSGIGAYLRELLVGADEGARAFVLDKTSGFVISTSHGSTFVLTNTTTTPPPLPPHCVQFRTDVACFEDPLLAYPLLRALGWSNLSQPLPNDAGGGDQLALIDGVQLGGGGGRDFAAVVADINHPDGQEALVDFRLFVFVPNDLLVGPIENAAGAAIGISVGAAFVAIALGVILLRSVSSVVTELAERLEDPWRFSRSSSGAISDKSNLSSSSSSNSSTSSSFFGAIASVVVCCAFAELVDVETEYDAMSAVVEQLRGFLSQAVLLRRRRAPAVVGRNDDGEGGRGAALSSLASLSEPGAAPVAGGGGSKEGRQRRRVRFAPDAGEAAAVEQQRHVVSGEEPLASGSASASSTSDDDDEGSADENQLPVVVVSPQRQQQQQGAACPKPHSSRSLYRFLAPAFQLCAAFWVNFPVVSDMLRAITESQFLLPHSPLLDNNNDNKNNDNNKKEVDVAARAAVGATSTPTTTTDAGPQDHILSDVVLMTERIAILTSRLIKQNPIVNVQEYFGDGLILCFYTRSLAAKSRVLSSVIRHVMQLANSLPQFLITRCNCSFPTIARTVLRPQPSSAVDADAKSTSPPVVKAQSASSAAATSSSSSPPSSSSPTATAAAAPAESTTSLPESPSSPLTPPTPVAAASASPSLSSPALACVLIEQLFVTAGVFAGVARVVEFSESSGSCEQLSRQFSYIGHPVSNAARLAAAACAEKALVDSCLDSGPEFRVEGQDEEGFLGGLVAPSPPPMDTIGGVTTADSSVGGEMAAVPLFRNSRVSSTTNDPAAAAAAASSSSSSSSSSSPPPLGHHRLRDANPVVVVGADLPSSVSVPLMRRPVRCVVAHAIVVPRSLARMLLGKSQSSSSSSLNAPVTIAMCSPAAPLSGSAAPRAAVVELAVPPRRLAWHAAAGSDQVVAEEREEKNRQQGESDGSSVGTVSRAFFAVARVVSF